MFAGAFRSIASSDSKSITSSHELLKGFLAYGYQSAAGVQVNPETAMKCAAVYTSIKVLTETISQLPLNIYRISDGKREVADDHPLQKLISTHGRPNSWMTSFAFREYLARHVALQGNAYYFKNTVRGQLRELLPIHPSRVTVRQQDDFSLVYHVAMKDGSIEEFRPDQIFHQMGPSDKGFMGDNVVSQHADTIGLVMAQEKFASYMFANGVNNSGVMQHPGKMSEPAYKRLKESIEKNSGGLENAHKAMILEEGMEWKETSQTNKESQLVESRQFSGPVVCSLWRIPPHMAGYLEKATFSNIENLARQFVDYAMMPWLVRIEQNIQLQLLSDKDRADHRVKFNVNALLRGDAKTRAEFYKKMHDISALNPNEIREFEEMDPYIGGDEYFRPLNMEPVDGNEDDAGDEPAPTQEPDTDEQD